MYWIQREMQLKAYPRGFHIITREVCNAIPEIKNISTGILHVFIQHTSASLTLNENADSRVREDFESYFLDAVPENRNYRHNYEGLDDMPAHIKASIMGFSAQIPIHEGQLQLGIWQGIYLGEHRVNATGRRLILTAFGK